MSTADSRRFTTEEFVQTLQRVMAQRPGIQRAALSREVREALDWRGAHGRLSEVSCRVLMLRLQQQGHVTLPPSRIRKRRRRAQFPPTPATDPQPAVQRAVHELPRPAFHIVQGQGAESRRWNEYIARYHYLGYTPLSGNQMRYNVYVGEQLVGLMGFGASAWTLAARERFIGWSHTQRLNNLALIVNNTRFLILPWVQVKGLASRILGLAARELPQHWQQRYGYRPVLLETFVEWPRHAGTCYKAANWQWVGRTSGRGKNSTSHQQRLPTKDIWLYPLRRDFAQRLRD